MKNDRNFSVRRAILEQPEYERWRFRNMTTLRHVNLTYLPAEQSEMRRIDQVVDYLVKHGGI
jgi:hypothetical protein